MAGTCDINQTHVCFGLVLAGEWQENRTEHRRPAPITVCRVSLSMSPSAKFAAKLPICTSF
jgi:hypothetical protein